MRFEELGFMQRSGSDVRQKVGTPSDQCRFCRLRSECRQWLAARIIRRPSRQTRFFLAFHRLIVFIGGETL